MISSNKMQPGTLFGQRGEGVSLEARPLEANANRANNASHPHSVAFAGLFVFTLLLYARPQELIPEVFGELPLVKIIAIGTLIAYAGGKLRAGERFTIWPLEMMMLALIVLLGIAFVPIAVAPWHSVDLLTDTFFKVITIFVLMVNLITTRRRLHSIMKLVVFCGVLLALVTITRFLTGELDVSHVSKELQPALNGNTFDNTNELALTLDLLLPFAIVFAVTGKGLARLAYSACAAVIAMGAVITFSRGGFLGLISMGGVLLWKLGRGRRATTAIAAVLLLGVFAVVMPSGYSERLFTIFNPANDPTNSAQERQEILGRGLDVALHHPIAGVGMANFAEYSIKGKVAHNSYIEIAAELGWIGLLAYLTFLIAPFRSLKRIERGLLAADRFSDADGREWRELYYLSVGLQAVMAAFLVCSFFASSQYFWHPYYIVGYSIALRRIYAAQLTLGQASTNAETASALTGGALWKTRRTTERGSLI
jgi:O-antigen ligase